MAKSNKIEKAIQEAWGRPKKVYFHFDAIEEYFQAQPEEKNPHYLKEKQVLDLDLHEFFKYIDRTSSAIGQQYLYAILRNGNYSKKYLAELETNIQYFQAQQQKRINCQKILLKLAKKHDYYFTFLIYGALPPPLSWFRFIQYLQYFSIGMILLTFFFPVLVIPLIFIFASNLALHYWHKNRIGAFAQIFSRIGILTKVSTQLLTQVNHSEEASAILQSKIKKLRKTTSKIVLLKTENLQNDLFGSFIWYLTELVKSITLGEITTFHKIIDEIEASRKDIQGLFEFIGQVDVAISIGSLRAGLPYFSIPEFSAPEKEIQFESIYHPLVKNAVANDLHLKGSSLLLTGSNMSGKSTFIKAINLNVITSQVLNTSLTKKYRAPFFRVATSIRIKDDITDNQSYYMAEVDSIGNLIELSQNQEVQFLFTIDELFKGTNTIERISAAKAILEYINKDKNHLTLVSTHDIELTQLLDNQFDLYYFQEDIQEDRLFFDYKIKKGTLEKRNAINILGLAGYPPSIIEEAKTLSLQFETEKMN